MLKHGSSIQKREKLCLKTDLETIFDPKPFPPLGQSLCTKSLTSGQKKESKALPPGHKIREIHKHIYEL